MKALKTYASDLGRGTDRDAMLELNTMEELVAVIEGESFGDGDDYWPRRVIVEPLDPGTYPRFPDAKVLITVYDGWME